MTIYSYLMKNVFVDEGLSENPIATPSFWMEILTFKMKLISLLVPLMAIVF